jgi:hypothetical protein
MVFSLRTWFFTLILVGLQGWTSTVLADVYFHDGDRCIRIIGTKDENPAYGFYLCSVGHLNCVQINNCLYLENDLKQYLEANITDQSFIESFLNHQDGYPSGDIESFFTQVRTVLLLVHPNCRSCPSFS